MRPPPQNRNSSDLRRRARVPYCQFPLVRYADDAVVHCRTQTQARAVTRSIALPLQECGLAMNADKVEHRILQRPQPDLRFILTCGLRFWALRLAHGGAQQPIPPAIY
jgi:hypothetical protein